MNRIKQQSFVPDRSHARLLWFGVIFFAVFAVLSMGIAVVESQESPESRSAAVLYLCFMVFFIGFSVASFRCIKQLERCPVSIDDEGIWLDHLGKADGLVRWQQIHTLKERRYGQRLELFGENGNSLVKLEYQLEGFEDLREIVLAKIRRRSIDIECPAVFKKPVSYHVFYLVFAVGITALAYFVSQTTLVVGLLSFAVVILMAGLEYLGTVAALTINAQTIELRYPLRTMSLDIADVKSIRLIDLLVKSARHPEVNIDTNTLKKPIRLRQLGIDASSLHDILNRWKSARLFDRL